MNNLSLGERIAYARKLRGLTLDEIAVSVGVHKSTILRYEKDEYENPKLPVIESIARALRVDPVWLIGKSDRMDPPVVPAPGSSEEEEFQRLFSMLSPLDQRLELERLRALVDLQDK